ncbi:hypothetical protein N8Z92_04540 [Schleiferiaceae bacterium]|nr:hypothetical protein [Schleiferiaceae bacterium]
MRSKHLFIIWNSGLTFKEEIENHLSQKSRIVKSVTVQWDESFFLENLYYFYRWSPDVNVVSEARLRGIGEFVVYIIEVNDVEERWVKTSSGKLTKANMLIFDLKSSLRKSYGLKLFHSSVNKVEFIRDYTTLFGVDGFIEVSNDSIVKDRYNFNCKGLNGWDSLDELFTFLNYNITYVLLRGKNSLDEVSKGNGDIDILTTNRLEFFKLCNANWRKIRRTSSPSCTILIANEEITFDVIEVGDNYFGREWEQVILNKRTLDGNVFILDKENAFFTLLYHCLINKMNFPLKYLSELQLLSSLNLYNFKNFDISNEKDLLDVLGEYMFHYNYFFYYNRKRSKTQNRSNIKHLKVNTKMKELIRRRRISNFISYFEKVPLGYFIMKGLLTLLIRYRLLPNKYFH